MAAGRPYPSPPDSDNESSKKTPRKRTPKAASKSTAKKPASQRPSKKQASDKTTANQSDDKVTKSRKGKGGHPPRPPKPPPIHECCHLNPEELELWKWDFERLSTSSRENQAIRDSLPKHLLPGYGKIKLQKTTYGIQAKCTKKLRELDALRADSKTEGLKELIKSVRGIMKQSWKVLIVYFDFVDANPENEAMWSYKEISKLDVMETLTNVADEYAKVYERGKSDGFEMCTEALDLQMSAFMNDILALGKGAEGDKIAVKEWERHGTIATLEARTLCTEEMLVGDGESEDHADGEDEDEDDDEMDWVANKTVQSFKEVKEEEDAEWLLHRAAVL